MQITKEQFKNNLSATFKEANINIDVSSSNFIITPIMENNVKYNSTDDYIRLWMLNEKNIKDRYFTLDGVIDFLAQPNQKYPFWIKISSLDNTSEIITYELKISMRFRTPSQLKYIETGHPPFIFEKDGKISD